MISRMNPRYSERIHVTNHNAKWRNCTHTASLQMVITQEITRYKVIGQPINPFIGIADDFVFFIGCYSELIHGEYQIGGDDSGAISLWADAVR